MKHMLKSLCLGLTVGLVSFSNVQAAGCGYSACYDIGALGATVKQQAGAVSGAFTDRIDFHLTTPSKTSASVASLEILAPILSISGLSLKLFDSSDVELKPGAALAKTAVLATGGYYALISGTGTGSGLTLPAGFANGVYNFAAQATPVPLPAAVWLLGTGLVGFVMVARRKTGMPV